MRERFALARLAFVTVTWLFGTLHSCQAPSSQRNLAPPNSSTSSGLQTGRYYALIIANQHYKYAPSLTTPINDATEIAQTLHDQYGFETPQVLTDATREQIMTALVNYRKTLDENSNLLVYYAGHGHHDYKADEAYWIPVDALPDNNSNWISSADIVSDIKAIPSSHILVISDSCFSGYMLKARDYSAAITAKERLAFLKQEIASTSRTLMSSGGDEPVADDGAPHHSVFAAGILNALRRIQNDNFTASELFYEFIKPRVEGGSTQRPQYGALRSSGHEYGDFVFSRNTIPTNHVPAATPDLGLNNLTGNPKQVNSSQEDAGAPISQSASPPVPERNISNADALAAIALLKTAPGTVKFEIVAPTNEIQAFSNQVAGLFTNGGWKVDPSSSSTQFFGYLERSTGQMYRGEGIACAGDGSNHAFDVAKRALILARFQCRELESDPDPEAKQDIFIIIGSRFVPKN
jgi:hypothetical protein